MSKSRRTRSQFEGKFGIGAIPGVLTMAALCGAIWSLYEAWRLQSAEVTFWQAWAASGAAAAVVIMLTLPLGWCVGALWRWKQAGGRVRAFVAAAPLRFASLLGASALALVLVSYLAFGSVEIFAALFSSPKVRQIALALVLPFIGIFAWAVWRGAEAGLMRGFVALTKRELGQKEVERRLPIAAFLGALILAITWGLSFIFLAPDVFDELNLQPVLPFAIIGVAAVVGSFMPARRTVLAAAMAGIFGLGGLGIFYMGSEVPAQMRVRMPQYAPGTNLVLGALKKKPVQFARDIQSNSQSAVCKPGQTPPDARRVGRVGDGAPDIILLTVDAMRWDHTSLAGYTRDTTPHLKKRAESAAVFANAYTTASSTRQSFRGMFSGIYSSRIAAPKSTKWGLSFAPGQETLASYLSAAGYETKALSTDPGAFPTKYRAFQGFDLVDESPVKMYGDTDRGAPHIVNRMTAYLSDPERVAPRFVWAHMLEAHQPYFGGPNPVKYGKREADRYDSGLNFVDTQIERLLEFARGPNLPRPVIVIITADHGQAFMEHGFRAHGATVFGEEVHVPWLFWGPGIKPGVYQSPVSLIDLVPTVLDLVELNVPEALCGQSLGPSLLAGEEPPERIVYTEVIPDRTRDYLGAAIIQGDDKLLLRPSLELIQLFDLAEDSGEKIDRSDKEPQRRDEMLEVLREFYLERGLDPSNFGV